LTRYGNGIVQPAFNAEDLIELAVRLKPSTTFAAGVVLGEITAALDVQTLHATAALTAGTFTLTDTNGNVTPAIQWNAVASAYNTALAAATPDPIAAVATGGPLSTPTDVVITASFGGVVGAMTLAQSGVTGGTLTIAHTTSGTSAGIYGPYASGNSDGTQNPTGILRYPCVTDASGNITIGGDLTVTYLTAPMAYMGDFYCQDLSGLDANAVTKLSGRVVEGTVTHGILHMG
jgi:hypothetical protein